MYLTYDEFLELGGTAEEAKESEWTLVEFEARKRIDYLTANRVTAMTAVPEAVKLAMIKIIKHDKTYGSAAQASNPLISSFTTDGYSESFGGASEQTKAAEVNLLRGIRHLLYGEVDDRGVPLMYRGVYDG